MYCIHDAERTTWTSRRCASGSSATASSTWTTFNEPWTYSTYGYGTGVFAPGRCSPHVSASCGAGDSAREPYIVTHNILLAHATAVRLYRQHYQPVQKGQIGITLVCHWYIPYSNSAADKAEAQRRVDFMYGYMDPIVFRDYPASMKSWLGARFPEFTAEQKEMLKGSQDFVGVNYTTYYAISTPPANALAGSYDADNRANVTGFHNGKPISPQAYTEFLFVYLSGIRDLMLYTPRGSTRTRSSTSQRTASMRGTTARCPPLGLSTTRPGSTTTSSTFSS
jgi:beta-glucosidase